LNPNEIRETAEQPLRILLVARDHLGYAAMEDFLAPAETSHGKRWIGAQMLHRAEDPGAEGEFDLVLSEPGACMPGDLGGPVFRFDRDKPQAVVQEIIGQYDHVVLPLARVFPAFRTAAVAKTIHTVSRENAVFSIMTALPNILPSIGQLPWAVGEFASDTAVLTVNQIRMAFLLAAASDREVGYREQRAEIGSIIAGAWGWRSLARELTSKIPFGGGLIPKAAIAYAGTYVVGQSLERLYRIGYTMTRHEREEAYGKAFARGKEVASNILSRLRNSEE